MRKVAVLLLLGAFAISGDAAAPRRGKAAGQVRGASNSIIKQVDFAALDKKLGQWKQVNMPFDTKGLTPRQIKLVGKLVEASHYLEDIFLRQSDPEVIGLMESLKGSKNPRDLKLLR